MNKLLIILFVLTMPTYSYSAENTKGWWTGTYAKKKLTKKFTGTLETQIRSSFEDGKVGQILYRAGVLYQPNLEKSQNIGFLYGIIQSGSSVEKRYTLQHGIKYFADNAHQLGHRIRIEGRDLTGGSNDSFRFRYSLKYIKNFNSFKAILSDEVFINMTDEKDRNQKRFERNRAFAGIGFNTLNTDFEFGYLNQFVPRNSSDTMEHILVLNVLF